LNTITESKTGKIIIGDKKMNDCCVKAIKEIHDYIDDTWWFQVFILASPFVLIVAELDTHLSKADLVQACIQHCGEIGYGIAMNNVTKNQTLPDFVDAVKAFEKFQYDRIKTFTTSHMTSHILSEKHIANFWNQMSIVYDNAFFSK
jgi:hypothetical protein